MMNLKTFLASLLCMGVLATAQAQRAKGYFDHLDLGITAGSTGAGFSVRTPVGKYVDVRTGFSFMPHFKFNSGYNIVVGGERENSTGTPGNTKIEQMLGFLHDLTGYTVDDRVDMTKQATMWHYNLLFSYKPLRHFDNEWSRKLSDLHLTVGFYAGPKKVGRAFNFSEEAPTLTAVGIYNSLYEKVCKEQPLFASGTLPEVWLDPAMNQRIASMGMMGARLGAFPDGDNAVVVPDENGVLKARMVAGWSLRPYFGVGWEKRLLHDRMGLTIDAGCFIWGGSPKLLIDNVYKTNFRRDGYDLVSWKWQNTVTGDVVTTAPYASRPQATEGRYKRLTDAEDNPVFGMSQSQTIDMCSDIDVTRKDISGLVNMVQKMRVYPVLNITLSYRLY